MVNMYIKGHSSLKCKTNIKNWFKLKYFCYHKFVRYHHWKILLIGIGFLGLCWLGFKSMEFENDVMNLWIYNSSRLHNETSFISRVSGSKIESGSIETILQVSTHNNLLSTEFLLEHLQLLQNIVNLTLQYDRRSFTFSDFCQRVQLPKLHYLHDRSLRVSVENLMPCRIISPLNCFWEGSKLLDHDSKKKFSNYDEAPSIKIDWKYFNISQEFFYSFKETSNYKFFYDLFKEAGIKSGFISKPCLDVTDAFCPNRLKQKLSYESIVNEGCAQIGEHMDKYSKSIFIGKNNRGLQTLLLLQSTSHVLETMKINNLEWPESKIQHVMNLWLQKLRQTVINFNSHRPYLQSIPYRNAKFQSQRIRKSSFYVFTNNSLNAALNQANKDETLLAKYLTSSGVVMLFVVLIFVSSDNLVRSHCWLAITSTSLLIAAILSGVGLIAAIGFTFNALTTQVVPFVMVGLGLEEVIILTKKYSKNIDICRQKINHPHPVAQTLYDCATILMVSFSIKLVVLCSLTMIPVLLMRNFCIQILFIMLLQTGVNVFLYPCLLHLDSVRRESNRIDLLCCLLKRQACNDDVESHSNIHRRQYDCVRKDSNLLKSKIIFSTEFTTAPDTFIPSNVHQYCEINPVDLSPKPEPSTSRSFPLNSSTDNNLEPKPVKNKKHKCCWKFHYRLSKTFLHIIVLVPVQITVILVTILIIVMGLYSAVNIDCGLLFDSIFPRDSNEFHYIKYESELFRFQNFEIVTKELEYTNNQDILIQLHREISNLHHVELLENGKFWLSSFIGWLEGIQRDFDRDVENKLILANGTWLRNASKNGLLVMTLMVQDGKSINYKKLATSRLVRNGKVDERKFYLFLNVWRSMSVEYETQPCLLYPKIEPFTVDTFTPSEYQKEPSVIRMSGLNLFSDHPLQFVACKYFHKGQSSQEELDFVKTVRSITSRYTNNLSLPTVPIGNIFSLSEQYLKLRYQLVIVSIILAIGMFVISLLAINHFLASILATLLLSSSILSPMLFMNLYQIPLNATSGVMALWSGGLGFRFSLFLIVSYAEQTEMPCSTEAQTDVELSLNRCGDTGDCSREPVAKNCVGSIFSVTFLVNKEKLIRVERAFNDVQCGKAVFSIFLGMAFITMTDISFLWRNFMLVPFVGLVHSLLNYYYLAPIFCFYLIPKSDRKARNPFIHKPNSYRCKSRPPYKSTNPPKPFRSQISKNSSKFDLNNENLTHGKLSIIPEESSSVQSSMKSTGYRDNNHINSSSSSDSSQSQENDSHFVRQNVESSLIIHYSIDGQGKSPKKDANFPPELAVKTSFKYRQPTSLDQ